MGTWVRVEGQLWQQHPTNMGSPEKGGEPPVQVSLIAAGVVDSACAPAAYCCCPPHHNPVQAAVA
jgi:hypothetical protein